MPPPSDRQRLWQSVPFGTLARAAVVQLLAGAFVFAHVEPGTSRLAVIGMTTVSFATLPLGRLAARFSRDHPGVIYYWTARAWAAAVPAAFALTIPDAFDGTGPLLATRMCAPPFGIVASSLVCFCIGAQGALLSVPMDLALNAMAFVFAISALKLHMSYTPAYLLLHMGPLSMIPIGYALVSKYVDVHEAIREAAEAVVLGAAAREGFVVTDVGMHILAVNRRLLDVLGYEAEELVGKPVMELVTEGADLATDHAWVRRTLYEAASRKESPNDHAWSVCSKNGTSHPVRITLGEARCPINGTKMFTAQFTCMRLEQRNAQLCAEKERLEWEVASHHDGEEDPRERLGATVVQVQLECHECGLAGCSDACPHPQNTPHRTLGVMQDQATTDAAVSSANSFDHVNSNASPTLPGRSLVAPAPPRSLPSSGPSIISLKSSVMDTVSQAAKKSPTRAPPPPKPTTRLPRPKKTCSEPSASVSKPKAGNPTQPKRVVPKIERHPGDRS